MRSWIAVIVLAVMAASCGGATAATLRIQARAPALLDDAECGTPGVYSPATSVQWVHVRATGPSATREDSIQAFPGSLVVFDWNVPMGTYQIRAWPSIVASPWLVGCDTTITRSAVAKPARVTVLP